MSKKSLEDYLASLPEYLQEEVKRVASKLKLNEEQSIKLAKEVLKEYYKSNFEPGEAIGIITAQSISEPTTQMTMRTYHVAGSVGIKITFGLPRIIEIFDARKKPQTPQMIIRLKKEYNTLEHAKEIANKIIEKTVENYLEDASLDLLNSMIVLKCKNEKDVSLISETLKKTFKQFKVQVRGKTINLVAKEDVDVRTLNRLKTKVLRTPVAGIKGVENAIIVREGDEWVINTLGSNLKEIFKLKEVDVKRTYSNNIKEVEEVLGIEAARNLIVREAMKTLQEQGLDVDVRHLNLVADIMCFTGTVRPIGRYGVAGSKRSVLARAAFEETIKHLVRASIRNEVEEFKGIFENVMINQIVPSGTGMFDLIVKAGEEE